MWVGNAAGLTFAKRYDPTRVEMRAVGVDHLRDWVSAMRDRNGLGL